MDLHTLLTKHPNSEPALALIFALEGLYYMKQGSPDGLEGCYVRHMPLEIEGAPQQWGFYSSFHVSTWEYQGLTKSKKWHRFRWHDGAVGRHARRWKSVFLPARLTRSEEVRDDDDDVFYEWYMHD